MSEQDEGETAEDFGLSMSTQLDIVDPLANIYDLSTVCRICAHATEPLLPIFGRSGTKFNIGTKINNLCPIKVVENDYLPQCICQRCCRTLLSWERLLETCLEADAALKNKHLELNNKDNSKAADQSLQDIPGISLKYLVKTEDENDSEAVFSGLCSAKEELCDSTVTSNAVTVRVVDIDKIKSEPLSECPFCLESTVNMKDVKKHYGICAEVDEYLKLDTSKSQNNLKAKVVFGENEYLICLHCRKLFTSVQLLQNHISIIHNTENNAAIKGELPHIESNLDIVKDLITHDENNEYSHSDHYDDWLEETLLCSEPSRNELAKHTTDIYESSTSSLAALYKCEHCTFSHRSLSKLRRHITMLHMPLGSTTKKVKGHKSDLPYRCIYCSEQFSSKEDKHIHRVWHNVEEKIECTSCQEIVVGRKMYNVHKVRHVYRDKNQLCPHCGKLVTKRMSKMHIFRCGNKSSPYQCDMCEKSFNGWDKLKQHMNVHVNGRIHQCLQCSSAFKQYRHLRKHVRAHHATMTHCKGCNKNFDDSAAFNKHQVQHQSGRKLLIDSSETEVIKMQCPICNEQFVSLDAAKIHWEKEHERHINNLNQCYKCGKEIRYNSHKCPTPGKKVYNVEKYKLQQSKRMKERLECQYCEKFFTRGSLPKHIKAVHLDERKFSCSYCPAKFARHSGQIIHERTHTGEKPYICGICSRGFAQYTDCKRHEKRHDADRSNITTSARLCQ